MGCAGLRFSQVDEIMRKQAVPINEIQSLYPHERTSMVREHGVDGADHGKKQPAANPQFENL
jgi:hypothetical protein